MRAGRQAQRGEHRRSGDEPRGDDQRPPRDDGTVGHPNSGQLTVENLQRVHCAGDDADAAGRQLFCLLRCRLRGGMDEQHEVAHPLPEHQRLMHSHRAAAQHTDGVAGQFVAVAVGAVVHVAAPQFAHTRNRGQFVDEPGGHQQAPGPDNGAVIEGHLEAISGPAGGDRLALDQDCTVRLRLGAAHPGKFGGADAVPGQEHVHTRRRGVSWRPGVDDDDGSAGPAERDGGRQTGGSTADHGHLVPGWCWAAGCGRHAGHCAGPRGRRASFVAKVANCADD